MGNYHAIQFESETLELLKFQKLTEKITEKFLTFQPSIYRKTEEEIHLMEELNHKVSITKYFLIFYKIRANPLKRES